MERDLDYGFEMIHAEKIESVIRTKRASLIDIRSRERFQEGHIKNARNFPMEYIEDWSRELPEGARLILYCEHGSQSLLAARKLSGRCGLVYTVIGGYQAYQNWKQKDMQDSGKKIDTAVFKR